MDESQEKAALPVIDVRRAVVEGSVDVPAVIGRINALLEQAREKDAPIIFVQHEEADDPALSNGSPGWQLADGLDYRPTDTVVAKRYRDSFADTTLEELLEQSGASRLVVTGSQSDYCDQTTALSALPHGYDVTLVSDAHTTCATGPGDGDIDGASVIEFVNGHFATLRHPGRRVEVRAASEISF